MLESLRCLIFCLFFLFALVISSELIVEEYACFNTIFYLTCRENEFAVFETARFGRNDSLVSNLCGIPFTPNCDVDVHFLLNRACAGRRKCSIAVNTAFFGDPCGYEEFLRVTYRCVHETTAEKKCSDASVSLFNRAYLTSPNYPSKYYSGATCRWTVYVQKFQSIRFVLFDFELDVKRAGRCLDYLEIIAGGKIYFRDCGALGKQVIEVGDHRTAVVTFTTGHTSLTQRGFLIYFEGVGHGCSTLTQEIYRRVTYFMLDDEFFAAVTCVGSHVWNDDSHFDKHRDRPALPRSIVLQCLGTTWNQSEPRCADGPNSFVPNLPVVVHGYPTMPTITHKSTALDKSVSIVGVTLGIVAALLVVTLSLMVLIYYCHLRCSAPSGKCDPCGACRPEMASPGKRINIQNDGLFRQFDKFISCIHCSTPESSRSDNVYELALTLGQYPNTYSQKLYKCDESVLDYHKSSQNLKRTEVLPYLFPRTTLALSGRLEPSKAILEMMLCPHCYTLGETRIDEFKEIRNRQVGIELGQVCSASDGSMLRPDLLPETRSGGTLTCETERDRTSSLSLKAQSSQSDLLLIRNRISGSAPDLHEISRIDGQIGKIHHIRSTLEVLPNRHALYVAMTSQ